MLVAISTNQLAVNCKAICWARGVDGEGKWDKKKALSERLISVYFKCLFGVSIVFETFTIIFNENQQKKSTKTKIELVRTVYCVCLVAYMCFGL